VRNMAVLYLTTGTNPAGLFPMQNLTDDDRMTLAADAYALHYCAGRSVVEIIDRVSVVMDETLTAAAEGRAEIAAHRLAVSQCMLALCRLAIIEAKSDVRLGE
jgi:hypothetical protein